MGVIGGLSRLTLGPLSDFFALDPPPPPPPTFPPLPLPSSPASDLPAPQPKAAAAACLQPELAPACVDGEASASAIRLHFRVCDSIVSAARRAAGAIAAYCEAPPAPPNLSAAVYDRTRHHYLPRSVALAAAATIMCVAQLALLHVFGARNARGAGGGADGVDDGVVMALIGLALFGQFRGLLQVVC